MWSFGKKSINFKLEIIMKHVAFHRKGGGIEETDNKFEFSYLQYILQVVLGPSKLFRTFVDKIISGGGVILKTIASSFQTMHLLFIQFDFKQ